MRHRWQPRYHFPYVGRRPAWASGVLALVLVSGGLIGPVAGVVHAGTTQLVSVDGSGTQSTASSNGYEAISANGRMVAFVAFGHLASPHTNFLSAYVRDLDAGTTERVGLTSNGNPPATGVTGNGAICISRDGRYVAFPSNSTDVDPRDTTNDLDLFLRDRIAGTTELVSVGTEPGSNSGFVACAISDDGRYVAFDSFGPLIAEDTNSAVDVYVRDRVGGTTELISRDTSGAPGTDASGQFGLDISADGSLVVFDSLAALDPADTNGSRDVYLRDRTAGTTARVSVLPGGVEGNGASGIEGVSISADGRWVAFTSDATNFPPANNNRLRDVYRLDRTDGSVSLVSVDESPGSSDYYGQPSISDDGAFVVFRGNQLTSDDTTQGTSDIYRRNVTFGETDLTSVDSAGVVGNGQSDRPDISANGHAITFRSFASNLITNDVNGTNSDIFIRTSTDITPPNIAIDSVSPNPTNDGTTLTWHADENGTYSVRAGGVDCSSGTVVGSGTYSTAPTLLSSGVASGALIDGSNTVRVCVTDTANNTGSATATATKDTMPPSSAVTFPNAPSYNAAGWIDAVAGTAADNIGGTGLASVAVSVHRLSDGAWWNGSAFVASVSELFVTASSTLSWTLALPDVNLTNATSYTVRSRAIDNSTNTETPSAGVTFRYDTTAPTVTIDLVAPNPTNDGTTVTWHANEDGSFQVRVGGTSCADGTSVGSGSYGISPDPFVSSVPASDLTDGSNTIRVCVTDDAGNTGPISGGVTKDTTPPISSISFPLNASYNATGWTDAITGTASDNLAVAKVELSIQRRSDSTWWNGTAFVPGPEQFIQATGTSNWSLAFPDSRLTNSTNYLIHVQATDTAGNPESIGPSLYFNYDITPPSLTEPKPRFAEGTPVLQSGTTYILPLSLDWTSSDQICNLNVTRGLKSFKVERRLATSAGWTPVATISADPCTAGKFALSAPDYVTLSKVYLYQVTATDWAGNQTVLTSWSNGFKVTYTDDAKPTAIAFTGKWSTVKVGVSFLGTVSTTTTQGSTASWSGPFQEVAYVAPTNNPTRGTAIITITDWGGVPRDPIERSLTGPATPMQIVYAASVGQSNVKTNPGIKIESKDSVVVSLDSFLVLRYQ